MVSATVTELQKEVIEYIKEGSWVAPMKVMDSLSIGITMSMTVKLGRGMSDTEKECSRRHQLEELKEEFMKMIKSKKSLK